ncbi:hypothetical protein HOB30_05010, partial [Candidatus Falkowbacteria bacterium]|nr:hypothetical protein [Candidatus Falkowbacteria bacterium]
NHEGDIDICKEMIRASARCGVDAVKLQTVNPDKNYVKGTESYNIFKGAELTREETREAFKFAQGLGLDIFTTSGDIETIDWVEKLNPSHWKVSSGLITHIPVIRYLASLKRPLLISTGMANEFDIDTAIDAAMLAGAEDISLLQCTSVYPTPFEEVNLSTIAWLKNKYNIPVGFSDHSIGDDAIFLSISAGASLIEKHFSLDNQREGFDHKISLNAEGLKKMVERVRLAEIIMGNQKKEVSSLVQAARDSFLRYIVAISPIAEGDIFSKNNIGVKRTMPGVAGITPKDFDNLLGVVSDKKYDVDDIISIKNLR